MTKEQLGRTIAETILRRQLYQAQRDPKRSIRNLVDLGLEASGGSLQQQMLRTFQEMLRREDSPYYDLVMNTVDTVEQERLITFGLNLGWNALTQGAAHIRELERARGHNIPWSLTFHMACRPGSLTERDYQRLVEEGMELGIYAYFLMPEDACAVRSCLELAANCRESAFFLFLPRGFDAQGEISSLTPLQNVMLLLDTGEPGWEKTAKSFRAGRCLYGLYRRCVGAEDGQATAFGQWMESIRPFAGVAVFLLTEEDPGQGLCPIYRYALASRLEQRYPTLVVDFYPDILYVDVLLSQDPCFAGLLPDGTVTEFRQGRENPTGDSVRTAPLAELLRRFLKHEAEEELWIKKS